MSKLTKLFSKPLFTALIFFILSITLISLLLIPAFEAQEKQHQQDVYKKLLDKKATIDFSLYTRINLNRALSSFIESHTDIPYNVFEKFVKSLIANDSIVATMSYSKNFVITYIYPYEGHEAAVGLDLLKHKERKEMLIKTVYDNKVCIQGPVNLVEGGIGLITYAPIMLVDPPTGHTYIHGVTDLVIN